MNEIREKFKQYQEAIEASNIVSKTDINGIITFVNDEFCKISGYAREELIGANHNIVRHPEVDKNVFKKLWNTILNKKVHKSIVRNRTKDGKDIYLNTTIIPILDLNGDIEEFVAIRHDITNTINLNTELLNTKQELENLNKTLENMVKEQTKELLNLNENLERIVQEEIKKNEEKTKMLLVQSRLASMGEMLSNIAHQWRQPLNELSITLFKLKGYAGKEEEKFKSSYEHSKQIIKDMSNTIEEFRNFFNVDRERELFLPSISVKNAMQMVEKTYQKEGIELKLNLEDEAEILGFHSQLAQAVIILLSNSKDAMKDKEGDKFVTISIDIEDKFVIIKVLDSGGGIKDEIMDKIFEPYFTTKHPSTGTGIGLYMLKTIVENMNGIVSVQNTRLGVCFEMRLPIFDILNKEDK
ncbi:PAS domain-containing sensor histidine kinase [Campylobacter sp.]|uniref:PAS domain-containing sensor histidine kinase n=1 Tax=Campylobacter sp. TaxID=205 RepID=UPI00270DA7EF|nr:PAS domain-containing sensor histidine kinase [Campylobacter sp.]